MGIQALQQVIVPANPEDDKNNLRKKSLTGRFPVLETSTEQGPLIISDQLPIARFLAKDHPTFLGQSLQERAEIDTWVDFINQNVVPCARRVLAQATGKMKTDKREFSIAQNELKNSLVSIEKHLAMRNFLVGHQMTLADALLVATLSVCFELVLDKKTRDGPLKNTARYTTLILRLAPCVRVFGAVNFCKDVIMPPQGPTSTDAAPKAENQNKEAPKKK